MKKKVTAMALTVEVTGYNAVGQVATRVEPFRFAVLESEIPKLVLQWISEQLTKRNPGWEQFTPTPSAAKALAPTAGKRS